MSEALEGEAGEGEKGRKVFESLFLKRLVVLTLYSPALTSNYGKEGLRLIL